MAIKEHVQDTGIYRRTVRGTTRRCDPTGRPLPADEADVKQIMRQFAERPTLESVLDDLTHKVDAVLERACQNDPIRHDAKTLDAMLHSLRQHIAAGNVRGAVWAALHVGKYDERLFVRHFEPAAKAGREVLAQWRGTWVKTSPLGRRILTHMDGRSEADVFDLV